MKVFFAGAESPVHRASLFSADVERIAINVTQLYPRLPKKASWSVQERFPEHVEVILYPGPADGNVGRYKAFVEQPGNGDRAEVVVGSQQCPVWSDGKLSTLTAYCRDNPYVAIMDTALKDQQIIRRVQAAGLRFGTKLVGFTSRPDVIQAVRWHAVVVGSWVSAQRFGETQVWAGGQLHRYPAQQKAMARQRHRKDIARLGVDYDLVLADDPKATVELAIRSWQQWEAHRGLMDVSSYDDEDEFPLEEADDEAVLATTTQQDDDAPSEALQPSAIAVTPPAMRQQRAEPQLLPLIGVEQIRTTVTGEDGVERDVTSSAVKLSSNAVRACDTCYLAAHCPSFNPGHLCAYSMPLEIRTKDQLQSFARVLIEIQGQRVMWGRFAEELEGAGLDSMVSSEMDRWFRLVTSLRDISDTRDFVKIEMQAKGNAGVISSLFGAKAGLATRQLPGGGMDEAETNRVAAAILGAGPQGS